MMRIVLLATAFLGAAAIPSSQASPSPSSVLGQLPSGLDRLAAFLSSSSGDVNAHSYRTAAVERGDIVTTVQAAGTLNALVLVEVGSQVSGLVKELYVDFNSSVREGQVIARVEPEIYEAKVAQAQAELEMAESLVLVQRAQVEQALAEVETAEARRTSAKAESLRAQVGLDGAAQDMERKRPLAQRKVIASGELEHAENAYRSAEAQATAARADELSREASVRAAQAALHMAEGQLANTLAQVKQKQAILRQVQIDLERTYIRSPVTGTVVNRAVSGGQTLAASLQSPVLFTIAQNLAQMQVEASVVEADISRFSIGQPVTFTVDAYPERVFAGTVKQIRKAPQIVQNVVTYVVVIAAENPDELLLPGMTANLQVVVAQQKDTLKVPNAALRFRPRGGTLEEARLNETPLLKSVENGVESGSIGQVFVLGRDGRPAPVALRIGISDGRMSEILAGELAEGQPVITGFAASPGRDAEASSVLVRFRLQ
ncbi:efflux RND transporter periplasmic adaptor subunit [Mesorhizobium sp. M1050]|uniref:efflux RND transporter periplasmic adaptor subunit n=1 Tax=unclassified Mesorhizobium TaxID=325217 RepID=UPI00333E0A5B